MFNSKYRLGNDTKQEKSAARKGLAKRARAKHLSEEIERAFLTWITVSTHASAFTGLVQRGGFGVAAEECVLFNCAQIANSCSARSRKASLR